MKKDKKNRQMWKIALVFAAIFAWVAVPFLMQEKVSAGGIVVLVRTANLVSPTGSVNPHGEAEYQLYQDGNREIEVEIEDVNLPAGTALDAIVDGNSIGQIILAADQRGRLKLRTEDGQNVRVTNDGSTVEVRNGATVLVAGVLNGGGPNPTPSPSVSPTGSPTGSPTATPTGSPSPSPSASPNPGDLFAGLSGGTVNGVLPRGFAQYELHSSRRELEIRVFQINLAAGTSLGVTIDGIAVGNLILESGGEGRLRLRTDNGQTVPNIVVGSTISINNGGTAILAGTFGGATPTPSPTPGVTPSPSPSPSQGRFFETHPTGSQLDPPVATNANAEFKVFLSTDETQATLTGEFHNLSSAQTGARIETTVGTTAVIHSFPVIGGTNGNLATATINVTPVQVQQLRAGLWFAIITSANNPNGEVGGRFTQHSNRSDFDGDGSNDFAVFRPSTGVWYSQNSQGFSAQTFGGAADVPVSADYDGDGKTDSAIFRNVGGSGIWEIKRSSDGGTSATQFGFGTDIPVRGDFDGDGRNDVAVFRPSTGIWYVQKSNNTGFIIVKFGIDGDRPVATDFDGDGRDDVAVFRPSTGVWYWIRSSNGSTGIVKFGVDGDVPVSGDFDGDGRKDISVFRPSTGVWYIWKSSDNGFDIRQFGLSGDVPVAGNYDGDTKTDIAVFRPSTGIWYIWRSVDNTYDYRQFGLNGDIPTIAQ